MSNKIEVLYDGAYPNTCSGNLIIKIDNKIVYAEWHAICEICSDCGIVIKLDECGEGLTAGYYTC